MFFIYCCKSFKIKQMARGKAEEFKIQAQCAQWLWNNYPETRGNFIVVDNNSDNVVSAMQKRAMGMIRGAADTFFYWDRKLYFLEFKTSTGRQSDHQKWFELHCREHSEGYWIIRNLKEFQELILAIINK